MFQEGEKVAPVLREREIKILDFDLVRQELAALTLSPVAEEMARALLPASGFEQVLRLQQETAEGKLLRRQNAFNPVAVADIKTVTERATKGAVLPGPDIAAVYHFITSCQRWHEFFKNSENASLYPLMAGLAGSISPSFQAGRQIDRSIDTEGRVKDTASDLLQRLRRQTQGLQNRIQERLNGYIRGSATRKYLQEPLVTIRDGRYVLPVKQEYRQYIGGIVHDQSSSGATVFVEPQPVVEMQNELTTLKRREEQEIERILYKLSSIIADIAEELFKNRDLYAALDLIFAKGTYALEQGATEPELSAEKETKIFLKEARHPFIKGDKVPLTVRLGHPVRTLVITGPNTGGKTVALKTIGLMAAMAQSGLQIDAKRGTIMPVFQQIRADLGDEQSIAQSLSTFSAHMKNMIDIMADAGPQSLVLLDELGAGTDPSEGAALAMAILEYLTEKGSMTVATTHINELKLFAQARAKMQNAAMEFDPLKLTPTYKLLQGIPGQSNAFYIAQRLGLPAPVMEKAKNFVHRAHDQVESVIASLVEDQQRYQEDSAQAALKRGQAEELLADLKKEQELLRLRRDDILKEAREEARELIKNTKQSADRLKRELKSIKQSAQEKRPARLEAVQRELNLLKEETGYHEEEEAQFAGEPPQAADLRAGDFVYICSLRQRAEVLTASPTEAQVQVGMMKVSLPLTDLRLEKEASKKEKMPQPKTPFSGGVTVKKDLEVKNFVDLRGLNLDEAYPLVDKLLDNALWAGLNRVDVIHGKGTGKLREGLTRYLREHRLVKSIRLGMPTEGGDGVTVVELKA